jgi:hypothetical protein
MTRPDGLPDELRALVDAYCDGLIDDDGLRRLEAYLLESEAARRHFVAYFQLHTELTFAIRARRAASDFLGRFDDGRVKVHAEGPHPFRRDLAGHWARRLVPAIAACALIAVIAYAAGRVRWGTNSAAPAPETVAWLVNAQDCVWDGPDVGMPGHDMAAGRDLRLRRGLAELEFSRGARVLLQGPAELELISANEARLLAGSLTARVPPEARGFTVHTPGGKVVDLGTEFGLAVDEAGGSALRVFDGEVEAIPGAGGAAPVRVVQDQAAHIDDRAVDMAVGPDEGRFVRAIVPRRVVVSRTSSLPFERPVPGTLLDAEGRGVGLTHRLPGTGTKLSEWDPNLRLDPTRGALELTTTSSDINTQFHLGRGEYLGLRLADLGFTGDEDFEVVATLPNIPGLSYVGQFGLYVGSRSDRVIRGGLIRHEEPNHYSFFFVNNDGGRDSDLEEIGLTNIGDDLRLVLRRSGGAYSLVVENLTRRSSSTLAIAHPAYLDGERDLYVGLFGASPNTEPKTLTIRHVGVTVWDTKGGPAPPEGKDQPGAAR